MEDAHLLLSPKAVAASPPSPAGGGAAAKGLERRDRERRGRWMDRHVAWTRKHGEVHNGGHRDAFVALATELCAPPMATRRAQSDKREKRRREEEEESAEETKKRSPVLAV
ncbi:Os11g0235400 [Oryza sativa Japonica Group]|uniref:Os11g0235400 protein n=1 Tax=Oryza sativa subsp. japonica TaxID=39947 RepID=A0A0P0Y0C6_ORYSJ|nr:Os11g0235400 [Oryza sativa Japonica Group]